MAAPIRLDAHLPAYSSRRTVSSKRRSEKSRPTSTTIAGGRRLGQFWHRCQRHHSAEIIETAGQSAIHGDRWRFTILGAYKRRWAPYVQAHGPGQGQLPLDRVWPQGLWFLSGSADRNRDI